MEEFRDIVGYEGLYQVSNLCRIKSLKYRNHRILKQCDNGEGYLQVCLYKNKKKRMFKVHRLVGISFIENPNNYPLIDHINRDRTDNRIENLRWCNYSTNNFNKFKKGHIHITTSNTYQTYCYFNKKIYYKSYKTKEEAEEHIELYKELQNIFKNTKYKF